mgnify:FL=1
MREVYQIVTNAHYIYHVYAFCEKSAILGLIDYINKNEGYKLSMIDIEHLNDTKLANQIEFEGDEDNATPLFLKQFFNDTICKEKTDPIVLEQGVYELI